VFGYFSDIIGEVFFPPQKGNRAMVESFIVFGSAFIMRPCELFNHLLQLFMYDVQLEAKRKDSDI